MKPMLATVMLSSLLVGAAHAQMLDTPQTRLRPIGSPSLIDQYDTNRQRTMQETDYRTQPRNLNPIQQATWMQSGNFSAPPIGGQSLSGPPAGLPTTNLPTGPSNLALPSPVQVQPGLATQVPQFPAPQTTFPPQSPAVRVAPNPDYQPVAPPKLNSSFATIDNCANVTPPSGYSAASPGCNPAGVPYQQAPVGPYQAPAAQIVPPTLYPGQVSPVINNSAAPLPSLFTLGQEYNPVQVGQGIIGQPVAYVPGQPFRNFLRYLFP
jgi:hypothetical protein